MKRILSATIIILLLNSLVVSAQTKTILINGKVISFEESFPIEGVSIIVKGTKNATGTQADGTFNLTISAGDKILVISSSGYETQEVKITGSKEYDIVLKRSNSLTKQVFENDIFIHPKYTTMTRNAP